MCSVLLIVFAVAVLASIASRLAGTSQAVVLGDIQHYAFSVLISVSIFVAYAQNKHVDASLFHKPQSKRNYNRLWFAIWACLLVILPFLILTLTSAPYVLTAWETLEGSREQGGLPGYFLVKTCLPLVAVLMMVWTVRKFFSRDQEGKE